MDFITGPSQAAKEAAAVLNPTYLRKSRRVVAEDSKASLSPKNSSTGISLTNSLCALKTSKPQIGQDLSPQHSSSISYLTTYLRSFF